IRDDLVTGVQTCALPISSSLQEAEVVLLNTCSVRKKPEDKAFSLLGELVPMKKSKPQMVLGVCGCMAQLRADEIKRRAPHVDFRSEERRVGKEWSSVWGG